VTVNSKGKKVLYQPKVISEQISQLKLTELVAETAGVIFHLEQQQQGNLSFH
jgi:hypothetical protein